ncbi:MAG: glycoside hydrolase family 25 protein [Thermoanaerobaculia bacterium]|nr:glycoside hydrolase family 25 protein [Thermoanaerobaculia bacterium]
MRRSNRWHGMGWGSKRWARLEGLALVLIVASFTGIPLAWAADEPPTGIDVSHHSGAVDWSQVHSGGYAFAYVKATEGVDLVDERFDEYWAALKDAGLARGAYHFYVTEDDPEEQAHFFLDKVHHEAGDLAPVVDIELLGHGTSKGLADRVRKFLEIVEAELGVKPIIYTSPNFWNEHIGTGFGEYPLWVAEYDVEEPRLPEGWERWSMWQWAEDQTIAGVEKGADVSRFNVPHIQPNDLLIPHRELADQPERDF